MTVVDASVVADFVLGRHETEAGRAVANLVDQRVEISAPYLLEPEVAEAIRGWTLRGEIDASGAVDALDALLALDVEYYPHAILLPRAHALRHNATVYDAVYLALAEALDVALLTGDGALAGIPSVAAVVDVVSTTS